MPKRFRWHGKRPFNLFIREGLKHVVTLYPARPVISLTAGPL